MLCVALLCLTSLNSQVVGVLTDTVEAGWGSQAGAGQQVGSGTCSHQQCLQDPPFLAGATAGWLLLPGRLLLMEAPGGHGAAGTIHPSCSPAEGHGVTVRCQVLLLLLSGQM